MEYLVTMTTRVPDRTPDAAVEDIRTREVARARSSRRKGTCCVCGVRRCNRANGARSACSTPLTVLSWRMCSPQCRCGCGAPMRSCRSCRTRMTRPGKPGSPDHRAGSRRRNRGVPDYVPRHRPGGHTRPGCRGHRGARGATHAGAGQAGAPATAVDAVRPGPRAGPVAGPRYRRDAGDLGVAAAGCLDERADHAAHPAPQRPGAHQLLTTGEVMSEQDHKVAIITGGSQGIGAGLVAAYRQRGWAVVAASRTIRPSEDPAVLAVEADIARARDRRPDHQCGAPPLRPHRHPDQQRRRVHLQAVHRLHR